MKYRDCAAPAQAPDEMGAGGARLCDANINALTGLATDYLNDFNEAIMLLEMLSACPNCVEDFLTWRPMSYREHFQASRFKGRARCLEHDGHGRGERVEAGARLMKQ